jgi:hypothetical protein
MFGGTKCHYSGRKCHFQKYKKLLKYGVLGLCEEYVFIAYTILILFLYCTYTYRIKNTQDNNIT